MLPDDTVDIRNTVAELIRSHPSFYKLKEDTMNGGVYSVIGIAEGLEEFLLKALERELKTAFLYSFDISLPLDKTDVLLISKSVSNTPQEIAIKLDGMGYVRTDGVYLPGDYSIKGGIVDIHTGEYITRLDYFGNDIDNISLIDPQTGAVEYDVEVAFAPYAKTQLMASSYDLPLGNTVILFNHNGIDKVYKFDFEPLPFMVSNDKLLKYEIEKVANGRVIIAASTDSIIEKIKEFNIPIKLEYLNEKFPTGFYSKSIQVSLFTDKELTGRLNLNLQRKKKNESMLLIGEINLGDLIVHEDHGVGIYSGVVKREVQGVIREYILLTYAKEDKLYIPLDQLAKLTKYIGAHGERPPLTRLGTMEWERAKEKVKKSVREMAGELLKLYALREMAEKKPIDEISVYYKELEDSFEYSLTVDQRTSIDEVMKDLRSKRPMDRLIVGDVGFGKTEVALRAAFKIVENGMQVAVLAPTTILAQQLQEVFMERMKPFSVRIAGLSRFEGKEKNEKVVKDISNGNVDIVIGTHRLLSEDVKFKTLGLVIIDEEQRFGVKQKEKLKGIRIDTNVLSMSATPIPRTLHMALSGARDISVINTPPRGRMPIKTQLIERNWDTIQGIIKTEVESGRQVYFVHNKVATIQVLKKRLENLLPGVRFVVGHGQMPSQTLEKVIEGFRVGEWDVLIASTIIENGIDISNVNTILINNAQNFGLSQLYQLRGRVGRSDMQSFCYLVYPENYELEGAARQRLYAIMNAQDLGSGFTIAVKDLEIRGAGNFLGSEQHGNISSVGFELFTRLLASEVARMKEGM